MGFECYRIGDLLLDAGTQEVTRNGTVIPVPRLSFKLLLSLARHAPNVVSAQQLEKEVWAGLVVDRGTVNKRVLLLRKALSEDKSERPYIAVIRGSGYRLVAQVNRIDDSLENSAQEDKTPQNLGQRSTSAMRTVSYWLLGMVAVLALYQGFQNRSYKTSTPGFETDSVTEPQPIPTTYSQKSIAVLPFVDLSGSAVHQFLGDGIAEEIINLLAGMDDLRVAARTSSFAFRDTTLTTNAISQHLKVGTILEGSIRHTAERIRVTAQLIDAQTGYHMWSKNYDRDLDELFEVQDDIAFQISQSLKLTVDENYKLNSRKVSTSSLEAFALYLNGRELFNNRMSVRSEGLRKALIAYKKAIELDPEFARAHAGIASVYWLLTSYDDSLDKEVHFDLAEASAHFALDINPDSTEALSALAGVHSVRGEIEQAAALFERIRVISSKDSNIVHWEAMLHIRLGYFDELIGPLTEVYRLDPLNGHIGWSLAAALNFAGEPEKAASVLTELKYFTFRQYVLGLTAINLGNYSQAREQLRDVRMRSGILPAVYADLLIDALEDPGLAKNNAQKFISAVNEGDLNKAVCFEALLILGSPRVFDLEVDLLKDLSRKQIQGQVWNNWAVAVRQDPRFKAWMEELGYVSFWRKYGWPDRCRPTGPDDFECI